MENGGLHFALRQRSHHIAHNTSHQHQRSPTPRTGFKAKREVKNAT
jgi:hypothetical protein